MFYFSLWNWYLWNKPPCFLFLGTFSYPPAYFLQLGMTGWPFQSSGLSALLPGEQGRKTGRTPLLCRAPILFSQCHLVSKSLLFPFSFAGLSPHPAALRLRSSLRVRGQQGHHPWFLHEVASVTSEMCFENLSREIKTGRKKARRGW